MSTEHETVTEPKRKRAPQAKWPKGSYHYEIDVHECVYCMGGETLRYRVPGPAPKDRGECYHYEQFVHGHHFC
jgi:hypothetical protein